MRGALSPAGSASSVMDVAHTRRAWGPVFSLRNARSQPDPRGVVGRGSGHAMVHHAIMNGSGTVSYSGLAAAVQEDCPLVRHDWGFCNTRFAATWEVPLNAQESNCCMVGGTHRVYDDGSACLSRMGGSRTRFVRGKVP